MTTCLWFDKQAEEAVNFYVKVFSEGGRTAKIKQTVRYGEAAAKASGQPKGSVLTILFELDGQEFLALNGGTNFKITPAVSFVINCKTQKEIDYFWQKLSEGGKEGQCGWIDSDKFGVTWQVVPSVLESLISNPDPAKSEAAMQAMIKMKKLDIKILQQASDGK